MCHVGFHEGKHVCNPAHSIGGGGGGGGGGNGGIGGGGGQVSGVAEEMQAEGCRQSTL